MPAKKSNLLFPVLATGVVVASGVAAYVYIRGGFGDSSSPLASAKIVPDEALMASFISTDAQAWSQLQKFGTKEAQDYVSKSLQDFNKQAFAESNIDYEKDLKPWVGGVMVAVLPANTVKPTQATPASSESFDNILAVVKIKDKISALNFANKLKTLKDVKSQETDYKGLKITQSSRGENKPTYSTVINNDYVAIAFTKQAIEKAIDTFKGEPSFASKQGASSLLAKGVDLKNSLAQVYLPDYGSVVEQISKSNPNATQLPPETLAQLKQVKALAAGIGVDDAGLRMKAVADVDPQLVKNQYQTSAGKLLEVFPADTIALISGAGISKSWNAFSQQAKNFPELGFGLDYTRAQLQNYNLDLDKDVFGWMDGEFAFGAISSQQGLLAPVGFGGALIINTSDRPKAEATLNKLDSIAKTALINVAPRNIGGKAVTEWQVSKQGALLGHGWLDNNTVFVAFGGPISDAIVGKPSQLLNNSDTFKSVTGSFPKPNSGYFYLDMEKAFALAATKGQVGSIPPEAKAVIESIRGIGMSASSPNDSTSQLEMLLALKPSAK